MHLLKRMHPSAGLLNVRRHSLTRNVHSQTLQWFHSPDFTLPFSFYTDASGSAIRAVHDWEIQQNTYWSVSQDASPAAWWMGWLPRPSVFGLQYQPSLYNRFHSILPHKRSWSQNACQRAVTKKHAIFIYSRLSCWLCRTVDSDVDFSWSDIQDTLPPRPVWQVSDYTILLYRIVDIRRPNCDSSLQPQLPRLTALSGALSFKPSTSAALTGYHKPGHLSPQVEGGTVKFRS